MKRRFSAAFLALALTLSLAACQGESAPPASSSPSGAPPASSRPEPPEPDDPPAPEPGGEAPLRVAAREYTPAGCYRVADVAGDIVLLWDGSTAEFQSNVRELDLATGKEKTICNAWMGQAQTDGEHYYWVSLSDTPAETGEYFPEGIRRKKRVKTGTEQEELLYRLPQEEPEWNISYPGYHWQGETRFISDLCLGEGGYLAWVESWLMESGEFQGWYACEVYALRPGEEKPYLYVEAAKRNTHRRQLWLSGEGSRFLIISTTPEDYPGSLLVYDLEKQGLVLEVNARFPTGASYDGRYLAWTSAVGDHTFYLYDTTAEETREVDVPFENTVETAGSVALVGGRYLLYDVDTSPDGGTLPKGVRLYDLETEQVVYRSYEDGALERKDQTPEASPLVMSRDGSRAAMLNGNDGPDKSWLWVFDLTT